MQLSLTWRYGPLEKNHLWNFCMSHNLNVQRPWTERPRNISGGSEQKGKIYLRCLQLPIFFKCILMRIYYFYLIIFATTVASCLKALWGLTGRYQSFSVHFMSTGVCKGLESSSYHVSRWSARVSSLVKCWSFASIKLWHSKPRTMVLGYRCTLNLYML